MRMIEIDYEAQPPIDGYGPGGFRIDGIWHDGALLITATGISLMTGQATIDALTPILQDPSALDVLLIGQGADIAPLDRAARDALEQAGIGFEIMSTPSACRTYNVLLTEDRRVGAFLLPV